MQGHHVAREKGREGGEGSCMRTLSWAVSAGLCGHACKGESGASIWAGAGREGWQGRAGVRGMLGQGRGMSDDDPPAGLPVPPLLPPTPPLQAFLSHRCFPTTHAPKAKGGRVGPPTPGPEGKGLLAQVRVGRRVHSFYEGATWVALR